MASITAPYPEAPKNLEQAAGGWDGAELTGLFDTIGLG